MIRWPVSFADSTGTSTRLNKRGFLGVAMIFNTVRMDDDLYKLTIANFHSTLRKSYRPTVIQWRSKRPASQPHQLVTLRRVALSPVLFSLHANESQPCRASRLLARQLPGDVSRTVSSTGYGTRGSRWTSSRAPRLRDVPKSNDQKGSHGELIQWVDTSLYIGVILDRQRIRPTCINQIVRKATLRRHAKTSA